MHFIIAFYFLQLYNCMFV